ncbi:MAG: tetratricopeptide repeat protein [Pirellulales bacterium]
MKSEHRHELETNWLAHHTAIWLERLQPYNALIVGALIVAAIALFAFSFFSGETSARQSEAWNSYNDAVISGSPNLELLRKSAGEYPDSPMQEYADITWADGQLYLASLLFVHNRTASNEAASRATSTYQSLLAETEDKRIKNRAHFGLARIYELGNDLDKAIAEYGKVEGGFKLIADQRVEELKKPATKDVYSWLATAQGPTSTAPTGPGTPGVSPGFSPSEIELPAASSDESKEGEAANASIDDLFSPPSNVDTSTMPKSDKDVFAPVDEKAADEGKPSDTKADEGASPDAPKQ